MSRYAIKFPFRVRIHGGEFDESARAIHREDGLKTIQAESGIVLESTIERKQMSTKTTFKRIALVTVAALGFGFMSVAPSQAANTKLYCSTADGTIASNEACNGVAGAFNFVTLTFAGAADAIVTSSAKLTPITAAQWRASADGLSLQSVNGTGDTIRVATPSVGTITVNYWTMTGGFLSAAAVETVTITVAAAKVGGVASAAASTSYIVKGDSSSTIADGGVTADATVTAAATYSTTAVASIKMIVKDGLTGAVNDSITATIASTSGAGSIGSGVVGGSAVSNTGLIQALNNATDTAGVHVFYVYANGIPGVATITLKAGTTTIATETVTFVGPAATYAAAVGGTTVSGNNFQIGANASALKVTAKDAAGNLVVDGSTIYAFDGTAATATVLASATTTSGVATFSLTGVAVGTSVVTFGNAATAATSTVTTTSTVEVTKSTAKTVALSFDKDSYEPGEKMVLTVTATDSNGKGVADGARALFAADLVSNFTLSGTATLTGSATPTLLGGVKTYTIYAPAIPGAFTVTGTEGAATDTVVAAGTAATITAKATITNAALTAAQEATDAANEATDAGNNAKDAADQAIEAADAATIAAQDAAAAAEAAGEMAVEAAEAAGAIAQDALDAANAATDAALSAAEAADAATAAAEEAKESADAATAAVAELSAEVAKLMAALTAKVTTLSTLVAKIAKKVKA